MSLEAWASIGPHQWFPLIIIIIINDHNIPGGRADWGSGVPAMVVQQECPVEPCTSRCTMSLFIINLRAFSYYTQYHHPI
jgi:hypothetical protein